MRHNRDGRKLNRTASHRKAMLRNMVTSLFDNERIHTTTSKAKEAKRLAERMITFARRGDLSARRHVAKTVRDPEVLQKLFSEIGPRYVDRPGGYTRVLKLGMRRGDAAQTAILELIPEGDEGRKKKKKPAKKKRKAAEAKKPSTKKKEKVKAKKKEKKAKKEAPAKEAPVEESPTEKASAEGTSAEKSPAEESTDTSPEPSGAPESEGEKEK